MKLTRIHLKAISISCLLLLIAFALAAEPALAAPGGIIKQAASTFWGKMFFSALLLLFAPLLIWNAVKRKILVTRTRRNLRSIAEVEPQFEWIGFKERVTEVFTWVHSAWDQKKMALANDYMTVWYLQNQQLILDKLGRDGLENVVSDVIIQKITPLYVCCDTQDPSRNRITVEIAAEMRDYLVDKSSQKVVKGDKTLGHLTTVWNFVWSEERWLLSMIEEVDTAMSYLSEPDKVPAQSAESTV